ncbi:MAG: GrpB family protein [Limnochordia bacterium]
MNLDEEIVVVEYDPAWPEAFSQEQERICRAMGLPKTDVEHIGSTAVSGLAAKPVIDLMLGLSVYPPDRRLVCALIDLGYECLGEAGVKGRFFLRRRGPQDFNLHLVLGGGDHWVKNLVFRDYLRAHPAEGMKYVQTKRQAISSGMNRLLSYSDAKSAIIEELMARALTWKADA